MQTDKILATLIDHPRIGAKQLAELSEVNRNTVETVLQRHIKALDVEAAAETGKRGRPENLYAVRPDWVPVLRQRWAGQMAPPDLSALDRALATLEAASFAAVDPLEKLEERKRMAGSAALQSKAARALLGLAQNDAARHEAEARIERAEARLIAPTVKRVRPRPGPPLMHVLWRHWVERLTALASEYEADVIGLGAEGQGIALVLDLIPGTHDPVKESLMSVLDAHHRAALCVPVVDLSPKRRSNFLDAFAPLALDPIARYADLFVTIDSALQRSTEVWAQIDGIAHKDRVSQAVTVANNSLFEAIVLENSSARAAAPARDYYNDFLKTMIQDAESGGNFWRTYGAPNVLDLKTSDAFQAKAEGQSWNYFASAASADLTVAANNSFAIAG